MIGVEVLPHRALGRGDALVGGGADRLGGRGLLGVETPAIHALERHQMPPAVDDGAGNSDSGGARLGDRGIDHRLCTLMGQALGIGYEHGNLR
jgi:hypothetical protein